MSKTARINFRNDRLGRRARGTIKAGAAAIVAVGLFASSPYTNEARAIDISITPNAVNASLVFSPTGINPGNSFSMCARNLSSTTINALYVFEDEYSKTQQIESSAISPGDMRCHTSVQKETYYVMLPYIVLQSPIACSQATEYPGKCRLVASFERDDYDFATQINNARIHIEPVLLPGIPGNPRINPVPLPQ